MKAFTGTALLVRFALRRDRVLLPAWVVAFVLITVSSASATMALYPDTASRTLAAATINDVPVALAMYGRIWDPTSLGALSMFKLTGFGAVMVAIFAIMQVVRHTRTDEERGRSELIVASPVGSWAPLASALIVVSAALVAIAIGCAAGLTAVGLPAAGAWAFGLMWCATGLAFAGIAAVCAQISTSARLANALAISLLAAAYLVRAIGDVVGGAAGPIWWSWVSPLTWAQAVRPFAGDQFWVVALPLALSVVAALLAGWLSGRRDVGGGLLRERSGRPTAAGFLSHPLALAWRLQWRGLTGWLMGYLAVSALVGSLINDLDAMLDSEPARVMIQRLGGADQMLDAFISLEFSIIAFATASFAVAAIRRLASEEMEGRTEPVLATSVSRTVYLWSFVAIAVIGTALLTVVQGVSFALAAANRSGSADQLGPIVAAALVYLPAIWVITALAVVLYAVAPRLTVFAWLIVVGLVLVTEIGALLTWPAWIMNLSPFTHIPRLPAAAMDWTPVFTLTAIAVALAAASTMRFRRRDLSNA